MERFIGYRLKNDVFSENGIVLLSSQTKLNQLHIDKLKEYSITINDTDVFLEHNQTDQGKLTTRELVNKATEQVTQVFREASINNKIPILLVKKQIVPIIIQITEQNPTVFKLFEELKTKDDYTFKHNIAVGVISCFIGKWMKLKKQEISNLVISAVLHDIGKAKIVDEILNKPSSLTEEEFEWVKKHTVYGYEILKNTVGSSLQIAMVALQHHEREDGNGYPLGIDSQHISLYSKIVAVADVFHAMSSNRVYHEAKPFYQVMKEMSRDMFGKLSPRVQSVFINKIMESSLGNKVLLSDGRIGKIIRINPYDPLHPMVMVGSEIVDLSTDKSAVPEKIIPLG